MVLFYQYPALSDPYKFILITILILMTLIEIIRLFLGYAGNLQEKVLHHSHKQLSYVCTDGILISFYADYSKSTLLNIHSSSVYSNCCNSQQLETLNFLSTVVVAVSLILMYLTTDQSKTV